MPNRESYLALHMPSTFCSKFPVDEFSSNFVLWFWLNEPKVCTWNILRYTFNFNMGNQSMAMIFYLPACVREWVRKRMPVMLIYNDHFLMKINKHTWNEYAQFIYSINEYWRIKFNVVCRWHTHRKNVPHTTNLEK